MGTKKRSAGPQSGTNERTPRASFEETIEIFGAKEHNLDVPYLSLPKRQLIVFTGVSGSGKSSLAFDTLYAEGQRRYVETLSAYARQFLGQLERPHVDRLRGLSPTIAIEQKSAQGNPRSTVGTVTEIHDYLRVLYARAGVQHCPTCDREVTSQSADEVVTAILSLPTGSKLTITAPLALERKGEFRELFEGLSQRGFVRVEVDGVRHRIDEVPALDKKKKHTIYLVLDRIVTSPKERARLAEAVELGLREGQGELRVLREDGEPLLFSTARACHGKSYPEPTPPSFSFNSPLGMCTGCQGLGTRLDVDAGLVVTAPEKSIREGAIAPWATAQARGDGLKFRIIEGICKACGVSPDVPWKKLGKAKQDKILSGKGLEGVKIPMQWGSEEAGNHGTFQMRFEGVLHDLARRHKSASSEAMRETYAKYMTAQTCPECSGARLRQESLFVRVGGKGLGDLSAMTSKQALAHFESLVVPNDKKQILETVMLEITSRLRFLLGVGLDYLTLGRSATTLSGGEAQRIRLASQIGSELTGVMYVLDEPSIGLHARDNEALISTLKRLRDLGNTVLVVEHDEETIRAAEHVVDFGPGAGKLGGKVLFEGTPTALLTAKGTLTGDYLSGRKRIEIPKQRRKPKGFLTVRGAREHNLRNVDVRFPLGALTAVTGVSGAGKSSLVSAILLPALSRALHDSSDKVGEHDEIEGLDAIDKVIAIDQKPIGRTPRSNPGTYTKAFDLIRDVFAELPDARARGFSSGRFSFNVAGGRCEACEGAGVVQVEMHFLADVYVTCGVCQGRRYNAQTLSVQYKGMSIADVLDANIDTCLEMFAAYPKVRRTLETLTTVGLGYMSLGQKATTMSGGEAQRVKLSRELAKVQTGRTLYVLDEPTTGLHFEDVRKFLEVLMTLVDAGNSVVVIEHNLDVIKCADWVIDLGPEGGAGGGNVLAEGTPEQIAKVRGSYTGIHLAKLLGKLHG